MSAPNLKMQTTVNLYDIEYKEFVITARMHVEMRGDGPGWLRDGDVSVYTYESPDCLVEITERLPSDVFNDCFEHAGSLALKMVDANDDSLLWDLAE